MSSLVSQISQIVYQDASNSTSFREYISKFAHSIQKLQQTPQLAPHNHQNSPKATKKSLFFPFHLKGGSKSFTTSEFNHHAKSFPTALCDALLMSLENHNHPNSQGVEFKDIANPAVLHDATLDVLDISNPSHLSQVPYHITTSLLIFHLLFTYTAIQETLFHSTNPQLGEYGKLKVGQDLFIEEVLNQGYDYHEWLDIKIEGLLKDLKQTLFACGIAPIDDNNNDTDGNDEGDKTMNNSPKNYHNQQYSQLLVDSLIIPCIQTYRDEMMNYITKYKECKAKDPTESPSSPIPFLKPTFTFFQLSRWLEVLLDCSSVNECLFIIPYLETLASMPASSVDTNNFFPSDSSLLSSIIMNDDTISTTTKSSSLLVQRWTTQTSPARNILIRMASQSSILFPRMLNLFSKRLSNEQYPRLKGRINLLASFLFNSGDMFLVNLVGANNTAVTYENNLNNDNQNESIEDGSSGDSNNHFESSEATQIIKTISKYVTHRYHYLMVTPSTTIGTSTTIPPPNDQSLPQITTMTEFYTIFWSIQSYFSNPQLLSSKDGMEMLKFLYLFDVILTFFEHQSINSNSFSFRLRPSHLSAKNPIISGSTFSNKGRNDDKDAINNNNENDENGGDNDDNDGLSVSDITLQSNSTTESVEIPFFPRYLPSKALFPLQLYDSNVRKSLLLQFVFFTNLLYIIPESSGPALKRVYDLGYDMVKRLPVFTNLTQRCYHLLGQIEHHAKITTPAAPLPVFHVGSHGPGGPQQQRPGGQQQLQRGNNNNNNSNNSNNTNIVGNNNTNSNSKDKFTPLSSLENSFANAAKLQIDAKAYQSAMTSMYGNEINSIISPFLGKIGIIQPKVFAQTYLSQAGKINIHILNQVLRHTEAKWLKWKLSKCYQRVLHTDDSIKYKVPSIEMLFSQNRVNETFHGARTKPLDSAAALFSKDFTQYTNVISRLCTKVESSKSGIINNKKNKLTLMKQLTILVGRTEPFITSALFHKEKLPQCFEPFTKIPLFHVPYSLLSSISSQLRAVRSQRAFRVIEEHDNTTTAPSDVSEKSTSTTTTTTTITTMSVRDRLLTGLDSLGGLDENDENDEFSDYEGSTNTKSTENTSPSIPTPVPMTVPHLVGTWVNNFMSQQAGMYNKPGTIGYLTRTIKEVKEIAPIDPDAPPIPPITKPITTLGITKSSSHPPQPIHAITSLLEPTSKPSQNDHCNEIKQLNTTLDQNDNIPRCELEPFTFIPYGNTPFAVEQFQQRYLYQPQLSDDWDEGCFGSEDYSNGNDDNDDDDIHNAWSQMNHQQHNANHFTLDFSDDESCDDDDNDNDDDNTSVNIKNDNTDMNNEISMNNDGNDLRNYTTHIAYNFNQTVATNQLHFYYNTGNNINNPYIQSSTPVVTTSTKVIDAEWNRSNSDNGKVIKSIGDHLKTHSQHINNPQNFNSSPSLNKSNPQQDTTPYGVDVYTDAICITPQIKKKLDNNVYGNNYPSGLIKSTARLSNKDRNNTFNTYHDQLRLSCNRQYPQNLDALYQQLRDDYQSCLKPQLQHLIKQYLGHYQKMVDETVNAAPSIPSGENELTTPTLTLAPSQQPKLPRLPICPITDRGLNYGLKYITAQTTKLSLSLLNNVKLNRFMTKQLSFFPRYFSQQSTILEEVNGLCCQDDQEIIQKFGAELINIATNGGYHSSSELSSKWWDLSEAEQLTTAQQLSSILTQFSNFTTPSLPSIAQWLKNLMFTYSPTVLGLAKPLLVKNSVANKNNNNNKLPSTKSSTPLSQLFLSASNHPFTHYDNFMNTTLTMRFLTALYPEFNNMPETVLMVQLHRHLKSLQVARMAQRQQASIASSATTSGSVINTTPTDLSPSASLNIDKADAVQGSLSPIASTPCRTASAIDDIDTTGTSEIDNGLTTPSEPNDLLVNLSPMSPSDNHKDNEDDTIQGEEPTSPFENEPSSPLIIITNHTNDEQNGDDEEEGEGEGGDSHTTLLDESFVQLDDPSFTVDENDNTASGDHIQDQSINEDGEELETTLAPKRQRRDHQ